MKSKYLKYDDNEITIYLKDEQGIYYDYFIDSYSGILEWTYETLLYLLDIFNNVDYSKNSEKFYSFDGLNHGFHFKPDKKFPWDYGGLQLALRKYHDTNEVQSTLKCFDSIVEEIERGIQEKS